MPNSKSNNLGDYLSAINYSKKPIMDDDAENESGYPAYIVRRLMSYHIDTIIPVAHMNTYTELPNKMQFDYLRLSTSKRKRFSKFAKEEKERLANLKLVEEYYDVSRPKCREILAILTEEDLTDMKKELYKGGKTRPPKN